METKPIPSHDVGVCLVLQGVYLFVPAIMWDLMGHCVCMGSDYDIQYSIKEMCS